MGKNGFDAASVKSSLKAFLSQPLLPLARTGSYGDDDSFLEKGILDSTGVLELVAFIEKTFAISVRDTEMLPENLDSFNAIERFVTKKRAPDIEPSSDVRVTR